MVGDVGAPPTLREVYGLIEKLETKLVAEMAGLETMIEAKLVAHEQVHKDHAHLHDRESDKRSSQLRWAVTTILTLAGVIAGTLVSLYVAARP